MTEHYTRCGIKRRSLWNLEDIVVKLKKAKTPYEKTIKGIERCMSQEYIPRTSYESLTRSPTYEKGMRKDYDTSKLGNIFEEKSSFVTLLEQRDEMNYKGQVEEPVSKPTPHQWQYSDQLNTLLIPKKSKDFQLSILEDKIPETRCEKCNKRFYRRSQLIRHLANHVVHECSKCGSVFYCVRKFKKHMATHESWPCEFCDETFYEASAWYKHRATHTMVACSSCDAVYYSKATLYKHKINHMFLICPHCKRTYDSVSQWSNHRMSDGKPCGSCIFSPIIACKVCKEKFLSQDYFLNHQCKYANKRGHVSKQAISKLMGIEKP